MSDGNFNRALLPHTPFASGLKAGKAMVKSQVMETFESWLDDALPQLAPDERERLLTDFRRRLVAAIGL